MQHHLHISNMERYAGWCCILNCFMLSSLPCFYAFCCPTSCYVLNVFYSCSCHFFSSRCMLELKFVIYCRAACPPSQASYAVLAGESQASFKHSRSPTVFLIRVIHFVAKSSKFKVICAHA